MKTKTNLKKKKDLLISYEIRKPYFIKMKGNKIYDYPTIKLGFTGFSDKDYVFIIFHKNSRSLILSQNEKDIIKIAKHYGLKQLYVRTLDARNVLRLTKEIVEDINFDKEKDEKFYCAYFDEFKILVISFSFENLTELVKDLKDFILENLIQKEK